MRQPIEQLHWSAEGTWGPDANLACSGWKVRNAFNAQRIVKQGGIIQQWLRQNKLQCRPPRTVIHTAKSRTR